MMGWYAGDLGYGLWLIMGLFWLLLIGVIIWAVVRLLPLRHDGGHDVESPEEILDRRFAQGEIDIETYQAQRAALTSARSGSRRPDHWQA